MIEQGPSIIGGKGHFLIIVLLTFTSRKHAWIEEQKGSSRNCQTMFPIPREHDYQQTYTTAQKFVNM